MHVETVESALTNNLAMIHAQNTNDYLLIGLASTHDGASGICDELRRRLDEMKAERATVNCPPCGEQMLAVNMTFCARCNDYPEMYGDCATKHEAAHSEQAELLPA